MQAKQQQMVLEIYGPDTEFYAFLWAEQLDLYLGGDLSLPPNTNVVWTGLPFFSDMLRLYTFIMLSYKKTLY